MAQLVGKPGSANRALSPNRTGTIARTPHKLLTASVALDGPPPGWTTHVFSSLLWHCAIFGRAGNRLLCCRIKILGSHEKGYRKLGVAVSDFHTVLTLGTRNRKSRGALCRTQKQKTKAKLYSKRTSIHLGWTTTK